MAIKQIIIIPIYWGAWWVPAANNAYNWAEVNGLLQTAVGGRYMDCLNQYGLGRGWVSTTHVYQLDPPVSGFSDYMRDYMFRTAIDGGHVPAPSDFDLARQQPFYCLIVKPGIEHLLAPSLAPDINTGAYHYPFQSEYWAGGAWPGGQVCWVKGDSTSQGTVQRVLHEMAEAYSAAGEISDKCASQGPVVVDGVRVPQYWSVADNACCPTADPILSTPDRFSKLALSAVVIEKLFGIVGDGGGLAHQGATPLPVDPWGWLTDTQLEVAFARATVAVEEQFQHDALSQHRALNFLRALQALIENGFEEVDDRPGNGKGPGEALERHPAVIG